MACQRKRSQTYNAKGSQYGPVEPDQPEETRTDPLSTLTSRENTPDAMETTDESLDLEISCEGTQNVDETNLPLEVKPQDQQSGPTDDHMDPPYDRRREDNCRSVWSEDSDDEDKGKPVTEFPDQEGAISDSESEPDLTIPIRYDMRALQLRLRDRELCPSPDHTPGTPSRGMQNHYDGSKLKEMIQKGDTFTREMSFQRGSRKFTKRDLEYFSIEVDRVKSAPKPLGLQYAPVPYVVPNGMMSALDIFPYAKDDDRRESYFMAYGITLATENRFGKTVYYNGDANICITEPIDGVTIEVPNRARTNSMRQQMFRMGEYASRRKKNRTRKDQIMCTRSAAGNNMTWNIMERDELEAVLDDLVENPMEDENLRTYSLLRRSDGQIEVRPVLGQDKEARRTCDPDRDNTSQEKEDKEMSDHDAEPITTDQDQLTKLGRDPQTPDRTPVESRVERNARSLVNSEYWSDTQGAAPPENDLSNEGLVLVEDEDSIKERNLRTVKSPCPECVARDLNKTDTLSDGQYSLVFCQNPCDEPEQMQAQEPTAPPVSPPQKRDVRDPPLVLLAPLEGGQTKEEWMKSTARGMEGPGILAAAHLVELRDERLPLGERSFAAFNAVIVGHLDKGYPSFHQGHAYIRLYGSNYSEFSGNGPPSVDRSAVLATEPLDSAREYLESVGLMLDPKDTQWANFIRRNRANLKNPLMVLADLSIRNERDEDVSIEEAVSGLRALKNEVRYEDEARTPARQKNGKLSSYGKFIAILKDDLLDELREPPLPIKHDRSLHRIPLEDLPRLPAVLKDLVAAKDSAVQNSESKESNQSLWYPEDIPVRNRSSFRPEDDKSAPSQKISSPAVKVEKTEVVLTESPSKLSQPTDLPAYEVVSKDEPMVDVREALSDVPSGLPDLEEIPSTEDGEIVVVGNPRTEPSEVSHPIKRILTNLGFLIPEIEQMQVEEGRTLVDGLATYGLLQVVRDLAKAKTEGIDLGQEYWEGRVAEALKQQVLYDEKMTAVGVEAMVEDEPCKVSLMVRKNEDQDIEMITHLETLPNDKVKPVPPHPPTSPVDWFPDVEVPPYVPHSPISNSGEPYMPKSPESPQLADVLLQVSELEDRVEESNADLQRRVKQLEDQVYLDRCVLTELKWKQDELKKQENRIWTSRKKASRKNAPNPPSHRYPTRYSAANVDGRLAKARKNIDEVVERIGKLEKRVEDTNREIERLKSKIDQVLELAPRLEELSKVLDAHRKAQGDTNSVVLSEIATFRNTTAPELKAQIKNNTLEIANLQQSYQQLYTLAASLLYSAQSGYNSRNNYSNFFPINNVPERKAVTVF